MALTIVAIPSKDDRVWQLSSEKVPHLTLLFLDDVPEINRVAGFVQHAASTVLSRFYLDVTDRGVLGEKSADVLFFNIQNAKSLRDFRQSLLTDTDIFTAYNNLEQFPEWLPHLTMGYPESPAKPDDRDYPGIHAVRFDRIALWTGDYEGVEIPLKTNDQLEVAMTATLGANYIKHYGVKGMKWGVIRGRAAAGARAYKKATLSEDAKKAKMVRGKAKITGVDSLTNKDLQTVINRMNLEMQYSTLKQVEHEQSLLGKGKKWAGNFATDVLRDVTSSWLRNPFAGRQDDNPRRTQAWANGQRIGAVLETAPRHKAIGR